MNDIFDTKDPTDEFFDYIGQISLDPVSLRRIFFILTKNLYSDTSHYGESNADFKKYLISNDPALNTLHIDYDYNDDPNKENATTNLPEIYVGIGDLKYSKKVLDKFYGRSEDNATTYFHDQVASQILIKHESTNPDDCLSLGHISTSFYNGIRKKLMGCMRLLLFEVDTLSTVRLISEENEPNRRYRVDLSINIVFNSTQDVSEESHRIKKIALDLST